MKSLNVIRDILDEIITILSFVEETNWQIALKTFRNRCDSISTIEGEKTLSIDLIRMYGGMGSFSDLILYKDRKLLQKETSQLDFLRRKLFEAAEDLR